MNWKKILGNLDMSIAVVALAALILLTFVGVIMRYSFGRPIVWQEEIQLGLITWVIFLGGSAAFRTANHMAIEIIVDLLPAGARKAVEAGIHLLVTAVLAFFGYNAVLMVGQFATRSRITAVLGIPAQYIYFIIPVGCLLMIVSNAYNAWMRMTGRTVPGWEAEADWNEVSFAEAGKDGQP